VHYRCQIARRVVHGRPGRGRPTRFNQCAPRRWRAAASCGSGTHISEPAARPPNRKSRGNTPTTVVGAPSMMIVAPIALGAPPNCRRHMSSPSTTTFGAPGSSRRAEGAPERGPHAQHGEEIRRDRRHRAAHRCSRLATRRVSGIRLCQTGRASAREDLRSQGTTLRIACRSRYRISPRRERSARDAQTAAVEQHRVHHAENCRIRADTQGERENGGSESRTRAEPAETDAYVLRKRLDSLRQPVRRAARRSMSASSACAAAMSPYSRRARTRRRRANVLSHEILYAALDMEGHLVVDRAIDGMG
jgi:hypothetical protein